MQQAPITVSQKTSLVVLGIDGAHYLRHLRAHPEIPRRRVGRLLVTAVASWLPSNATPAPVPTPHTGWSLTDAVAKAHR